MPKMEIVGDIAPVVNAAREYTNLTNRICKQITQECAEKAKEKIVSLITPYKDSGDMINSIQVRPVKASAQEYSFTVNIGSPHASYFFQGTGPSPGRYVPAIDRRLTARGVKRSRRLMSNLSKKLGMSKEVQQAIKKVPVKMVSEKEWRSRPMKYEKMAKASYYPEIGPLGSVYVRRNIPSTSPMQLAHTIRHELWHAAQKQLPEVANFGYGQYAEGQAERRAQEALSPIGMHPGTKDHLQIYNEIMNYIDNDIPAYATQRVQQLVGGR